MDRKQIPHTSAIKVDKDDVRARTHFVNTFFKDGKVRNTWECGICAKEFKYQYTLLRHIPTHTDERNFHCSLCSKSFRQMSTLSQHQATHYNYRPFQCKWCYKSFNRISTLISHKKLHTELKKHVCSFCGKGFHQKGNLKNHEFTHTNTRPYKCDFCGKGFNQPSNLTVHKRSRHLRKNKSSKKVASVKKEKEQGKIKCLPPVRKDKPEIEIVSRSEQVFSPSESILTRTSRALKNEQAVSNTRVNKLVSSEPHATQNEGVMRRSGLAFNPTEQAFTTQVPRVGQTFNTAQVAFTQALNSEEIVERKGRPFSGIEHLFSRVPIIPNKEEPIEQNELFFSESDKVITPYNLMDNIKIKVEKVDNYIEPESYGENYGEEDSCSTSGNTDSYFHVIDFNTDQSEDQEIVVKNEPTETSDSEDITPFTGTSKLKIIQVAYDFKCESDDEVLNGENLVLTQVGDLNANDASVDLDFLILENSSDFMDLELSDSTNGDIFSY